jgi:hypothetical protein
VTGGAALIRTTRPADEFMAKVKANVGNYSTYEVSGVVTGPLIEDKLLGKLAIFHKQRDDFVDNINKDKALAPNADDFGELNQQNYRGASTWRPTGNVPGRQLDAAGLNALFGALSPRWHRRGRVGRGRGDRRRRGWRSTQVRAEFRQPEGKLVHRRQQATGDHGLAGLQPGGHAAGLR